MRRPISGVAPAPPSITGVCRDEEGKPLSGVHVALFREDNERRVSERVARYETDADGAFEFREVPAPVGEENGDLAVEQRAFAGEREHRFGDSREAHGPIEPASAEQRNVLASLARNDAIAVIFDFVQPVRPGRHVGVECGEFRLDEGGN